MKLLDRPAVRDTRSQRRGGISANPWRQLPAAVRVAGFAQHFGDRRIRKDVARELIERRAAAHHRRDLADQLTRAGATSVAATIRPR